MKEMDGTKDITRGCRKDKGEKRIPKSVQRYERKKDTSSSCSGRHGNGIGREASIVDQDDPSSPSEDEELYSGEDRRRSRRKREKNGRHAQKRRLRRRYSESEDEDDNSSDCEESSSPSDTSSTDSSDSSSTDSSEEKREREKRRRRQKRRQEKEKEKHKRRKEKMKKHQEKRRREEERRKKKRKKDRSDKGKLGPVTDSWGKYGIIKEIDLWVKRPEFSAWLAEVKKVNLETLSTWEEKQMFKEYMEDFNTATLPKKYYDLDAYHRRKIIKDREKGTNKKEQTERTEFNDEEQRRQELRREREQKREAEIEALKHAMQSGMAQAMREQAQLREDMQYQYRVGNLEAAAAIQRRLDPDVPGSSLK
eukprot:c25808_g1_i1 orf=631-1725(-)